MKIINYIKNKIKKIKMKDLKIGDKLLVVADTVHHGYSIGNEVTFKGYSNCDKDRILVKETSSYFSIYDVQYNTLESIEESLEDAKTELIDAKNKVSNIEAKIAYMNETGTSKFNEKEYQAYNVLLSLEDKNLSTIERAKKIASIFN